MFGKIERIKGNKLLISIDNNVDLTKIQKLANGQQPTVEISVQDERKITPEQRKKIFSLINDLCEYTGDVPEFWKEQFKFMVETTFKIDHFSLSDCSVTVANYMILIILNFLFENDIPFKTKNWDSIPDEFPKQMLCIKSRQCVICGKPADVAHYNAVGAGRNRNKINHVGMYIMMLCRSHHTEQHKIGVKNFINKYHIKPIRVTKEIATKLKLGEFERNDQE